MKTKINTCPEFPYFGAKYPDATCIDGKLWDLDKCDENGLYSSGDNPPCPFCNTDAFIESIITINDKQLDEIKSDSTISETEKAEIIKDCITKEDAIKIVESLKNKYIHKKETGESSPGKIPTAEELLIEEAKRFSSPLTADALQLLVINVANKHALNHVKAALEAANNAIQNEYGAELSRCYKQAEQYILNVYPENLIV